MNSFVCYIFHDFLNATSFVLFFLFTENLNHYLIDLRIFLDLKVSEEEKSEFIFLKHIDIFKT